MLIYLVNYSAYQTTCALFFLKQQLRQLSPTTSYLDQRSRMIISARINTLPRQGTLSPNCCEVYYFFSLSDQGGSYLTFVRTICFAVRRSCRNRTTLLSLLIKNSIHFYTLEFFSFVCQNTICVWIIEISLNFHIYWSKIHQYTHT